MCRGDVDFRTCLRRFCSAISGFGWVVVAALALSLGGWLCEWSPRLGLLHHPDPSLSCNSFWGLSRRERCLDNPQKLLRAARIGVMQKNWLKKDQVSTWVWAIPTEAVTHSSGAWSR